MLKKIICLNQCIKMNFSNWTNLRTDYLDNKDVFDMFYYVLHVYLDSLGTSCKFIWIVWFPRLQFLIAIQRGLLKS